MIWGYPYFWKHPYILPESSETRLSPFWYLLINFPKWEACTFYDLIWFRFSQKMQFKETKTGTGISEALMETWHEHLLPYGLHSSTRAIPNLAWTLMVGKQKWLKQSNLDRHGKLYSFQPLDSSLRSWYQRSKASFPPIAHTTKNVLD